MASRKLSARGQIRLHILFFVLQEDGIAEVNEMIHAEKPDADRRLRELLDELSLACSRYVGISHQVKGRGFNAPIAGRTRLDTERLKLCQGEIVSVLSRRHFIRACLTTLSKFSVT